MKIEELKQLAEAATPGPWALAIWTTGNRCAEVMTAHNHRVVRDAYVNDSAYIAAANPAAVLELIVEVESLRAEVKTERALSFRDQVAGLEQQRDELLAALKESRELVEDWGAYAPAYMQEKHDLEGDLSRLDAVISKMETP